MGDGHGYGEWRSVGGVGKPLPEEEAVEPAAAAAAAAARYGDFGTLPLEAAAAAAATAAATGWWGWLMSCGAAGAADGGTGKWENADDVSEDAEVGVSDSVAAAATAADEGVAAVEWCEGTWLGNLAGAEPSGLEGAV